MFTMNCLQLSYNECNAALGVAQMEYIDKYFKNKRKTARTYIRFF